MTVRPLATPAELAEEIEVADRALEKLILARPVSVEAAASRDAGIVDAREYLWRLRVQLAGMLGEAAA